MEVWKMVLGWVLLNCALPWYAIWVNGRLKPDSKRDGVERFRPFVRSDYNRWSYLRCIWTHFFFIPRFVMLLGILCLAMA